MGSWGTLYFGEFDISSFKSYIPLHALLMFAQEDLVIGEETLEDEQSSTAVEETRDNRYLYKTYKFVTTAKQARHKLDARGLDIGFCREWFDQLLSDWVYDYDPDSDTSHYTENLADFNYYLQALRQQFYSQNSTDPKVRISTNLFELDAELYFQDAIGCIFYRCILEITPDPTVVVLEFSDLVSGGYIEEQQITKLFDYYTRLILKRIELDYKIYGFVMEDDTSVESRLRKRITELDEDQFLTHVLHPLLKKMGYEHLRKVSFHGPSEFGSDVLPFRYTTPFGTIEYYAVQSKATTIHGTSKRSGNAAELVSQATQAFAVTFIDDIDNERKRIDKFVIATNKNITADARRFIEEALEGRRKLVFLDIDRIVELVKKHQLLQYLLFSNLEKADTSIRRKVPKIRTH